MKPKYNVGDIARTHIDNAPVFITLVEYDKYHFYYMQKPELTGFSWRNNADNFWKMIRKASDD